MPNYTTWYDVGGFLTSSTFIGPATTSVTSASPCYLLTTTLSDGAHLWQLPSAATCLSNSINGSKHQNQQTRRLEDEDQQQQQQQTVVSRLSVSSFNSSSSSSSSTGGKNECGAKFTCCTATPDSGSGGFLCGAADGTIFQGSLDSGTLYRAASSILSSSNNAGATSSDAVGAFRLDDALMYISPLCSSGNSSSSSNNSVFTSPSLFMTMTLGGDVSIIDLRSKSIVLTSNSGGGGSSSFFHCGAPVLGSSHIALATDGGFVQVFDLRRVGTGGGARGASFSSRDAVKNFALKNQVTSICSLPPINSASTSTGFVAGTVAGRILTVRALDQPAASSSAGAVVREEAVALPSNDRYPITHVAAIDGGATKNNDETHDMAIVAAAADGCVSFFSKTEFANFGAQKQKQQPQQQQHSSPAPSWKAWSWKLNGQKPLSLSLTTSGSFLGGMKFPVLAASYSSKENSNQMSRMCVVSLCEEKFS